MLANNRFCNFSIAAIALLTSIIASSSPVQAKPTLITAKTDTEYTVAQFPRPRPPAPRPPGYPPDPPWTRRPPSHRRILARQWERQRQIRYHRCLRHSHNPRRCEYILRQPNPYMHYM
jgi:hypothetical protein